MLKAEAALSASEARFVEGVKAATETFIADYRRQPPPGRSPQEVAAYVEGFREAVGMYTAVYLATR